MAVNKPIGDNARKGAVKERLAGPDEVWWCDCLDQA